MNAPTPALDLLRPFQLESSQLRGRALRLGPVIDAVLKAHAYPEPVSRLLGELLVLSGAFAGALKYDGTFSLQTRGDGPVRLMVADIANDGAMRGYAGFEPGAVPDDAGFESLVGEGVMALTVDQSRTGGETYQGIVPLEGGSITAGMLAYFHRSEQVPTGICSAIGQDPLTGAWRGGAIVLQAMPGEGSETAAERSEDWRRAMLLLQTVTDDELLDPGLSLDSLLLRLFHEEGVRVFDPTPLRFGCSCSEERVRETLARFPLDELLAMKEADGKAHVTCQFCSRSYALDDAALRALAAPPH
ncbi:MAG: Hsp33 family molecular chaperone HslO [Geminicoccaceae bacterium]|nr:Hsp33 family molecular chaperone HslO [Geminicoccaceae bacterium]